MPTLSGIYLYNMATIPTEQKFHTLNSNVVTQEKGSALTNSQREIYTMQDIVETVEGALPPSTNPTAGVYPICYNDFMGNPSIFADGGLTNSVIMTPMGYTYLGLTFRDNYSGLGKLLELNPIDFAYTFGQAEYQPFSSVSASGGLAIYPNIGQAIIGVGVSSPYEGVFKVNSASGNVTIGNAPSTSIGVNMWNQTMIIGSDLTLFVSPSNPTTPVKWLIVTDENGNYFQMPLYQ